MKLTTFFAYDPQDSEEIRVEKFTILLVAGACCLAGLVWTAMYYFVFGFSLTTYLPLLFTIIVGSSLIVSHISKNHYVAVYSQIICIIYFTVIIQWSIGGVFDSGFVMVWSFLGPMIALLFFSLRQSIFWMFLFLLNIAVTVIFNNYFVLHGQFVSENIKLFFFFMNLSFASIVVFIFATYFVNNAIAERERANNLLLNVLPKEIAPILKGGQNSIADHYDSASVLFADIVGSTPLFSTLTPEEAVDWLNEIFTSFDRLVEKYSLEKIRTIGDNYMVAAGVPVPRDDHAQAIAYLALEMVSALKNTPARNGHKIAFRLGINSGPLVAGVIGQTKFHYDLWGDTVNIASRMESQGEAGRVHISDATHVLIKDDFACTSRGIIEVKGRGAMHTWFLDRPINPPATASAA